MYSRPLHSGYRCRGSNSKVITQRPSPFTRLSSILCRGFSFRAFITPFLRALQPHSYPSVIPAFFQRFIGIAGRSVPGCFITLDRDRLFVIMPFRSHIIVSILKVRSFIRPRISPSVSPIFKIFGICKITITARSIGHHSRLKN